MAANTFRAKIDIYDFRRYVYTCVYFPQAVLARLPLDKYPRLRINAAIDGYPCKGALMPDKAGSKQTAHLLKDGYVRNQKVWYFQVPRKLLRDALSAGKRRSFMHPILSARTEPTLEKRLLALADQLADL